MTDISDSLRLLYETSIERDGSRYVVPIPKELVENGSFSTAETYRVALLSAAASSDAPRRSDPADDSASPESTPNRTEREWNQADTSSSQSQAVSSRSPPVEEGDVRTVTIDTLGDQGDGIAKVERGFVIIVPDTRPGDEVEVEITDVKQTVAFAESTSGTSLR